MTMILAVVVAVDISDEAAFNDMIARLRDAEGWGGEIDGVRSFLPPRGVFDRFEEAQVPLFVVVA